MRVITINGRRYAAGLWWQVHEGGPASRKALLRKARAMADTFEDGRYTCVVLRKQQYGLGDCEGKIRRIPSLAASIVTSGPAFLGIFRLIEGLEDGGLWWVYAVKNGTIAGEGDFVTDSFDDARKHAASLRDILSLDSQELITEQSESIAWIGAHLSRPSLFGGGRLEHLYPSRADRRMRLAYAAGAALVLGATLGVHSWMEHNRQGERVLAAKQQLSAQDARRQEVMNHPETVFNRRWLSSPQPAAWAPRCLPAMLGQALSSVGWDLGSVLCADALVVTWDYAPGASFVLLPQSAHLESPQKAVVRLPLPALPSSRPDVPIWTQEAFSRALYQMTNDLGAHLKLSWEKPESKTIKDSGIEVAVTAPWSRGLWELSELPVAAALEPTLFHSLDSVPGLGIESLELSKTVFKIKGFGYAKP